MAWVEDISKRTQKIKHFYDQELNIWKAEIGIHDLHYKDDFDNWIDVDLNFTDDSGNFNKKCDTTKHSIHVANNGNRRWYPRRNILSEYVEISGIEYWTGSQWRNINLPTPIWTNNKSEWDMAHLYASLTNTWNQLKTYFILKDNQAPTGLRYQISFSGLEYDHLTGKLTSIADGQISGYIQKPVGWYADQYQDSGILVPIEDTYDGTYLSWMVDTVGVSFPIYVDPTFTDGLFGDAFSAYDASLSSGAPTTNYGNEPSLSFRDVYWNSLLKFKLSPFVGRTITSANLYLYCETGQTITGALFRILSGNSWLEQEACWDHRSGINDWLGGHAGCGVSGTDHASTAIGTFSMSSGDSAGHEYNVSLDLTEFASMISNNCGFILRSSNEFVTARVYSSDDINNPSYYPKLVVVYSGDPIPGVLPFEDDFSSGVFSKWDNVVTYGAGTATITNGEAVFDCPNGNNDGSPPPEDEATSYIYIPWPAGNVLWAKCKFKFIGADTDLTVGGGFFMEFVVNPILGAAEVNRWNIEIYSPSQESDDPQPYNGEYPIKIAGTNNAGTTRIHGVAHWWISPDASYEIWIKLDYSGTNPTGEFYLDSEYKQNLVDTSVLSVNATKPLFFRIGQPWYDAAHKIKVVIDDVYVGETLTNDTDETVALGKDLKILVELNENVILGKSLSITKPDNKTVNETVTLVRNNVITLLTQTNEGDTTTLTRNSVISSLSQLNIIDGSILTRNNVIVSLDQSNKYESVILTRNNVITLLIQTNEIDGITLIRNDILNVVEETLGQISETVILTRNNVITPLTQTNEKDSVILTRNNLINSLDQSIRYETITITRNNVITALTQTNEIDSVSLSRNNLISSFDQVIRYEAITLTRNNLISGLELVIRYETVTLTRNNVITALTQTNEKDSVSLTRNNVIGRLELVIRYENVLITRNSIITALTQINGGDSLTITRNNLISLLTQTNEKDSVLLTRNGIINIVEELKGQLYENLTLGRILSLPILTQTNEKDTISLIRNNIITPINQSNQIDSLILGRNNLISSLNQSNQIDSLIFGRNNVINSLTQTNEKDGVSLIRFYNLIISEDVRGELSENVILNRSTGINIISQSLLSDIVNLSQFYGLLIDSRKYSYENILLEYRNELSTSYILSIYENILFGKVNSIIPLTLLIAFNTINFERLQSIISDIPSLYVYNDGNHSVGVLFRDKRVEVLFRDKRASVRWRDKRGG